MYYTLQRLVICAIGKQNDRFTDIAFDSPALIYS